MNDLNCPSCGTTYQSSKAGFCDCCGYEFTTEYINSILRKEKKQEKIVQKKVAEENYKRQIIQKKEEKAKQQKVNAEKKAREKEKNTYLKEKRKREKIEKLIEKDKKRFEIDKAFSLYFKKVRQSITTLGIIFVVLTIVSSVIVPDKLKVDFIAPQKIISSKQIQIYQGLTIPIKFNEENVLLEKSDSLDDSLRLPSSLINLFNSFSSIVNNCKSVKEKISFMFPKAVTFIKKFIDASNESVNNNSASDEITTFTKEK